MTHLRLAALTRPYPSSVRNGNQGSCITSLMFKHFNALLDIRLGNSFSTAVSSGMQPLHDAAYNFTRHSPSYRRRALFSPKRAYEEPFYP